MILGLTGCPGSGKSLLAGELARYGWILVDADKIGREVVEHDPVVRRELVRVFGDDICEPDGRLQRRVLARRAFSGSEATRKLNGIVHPVLIGRVKEKVQALRSSKSNSVLDCALIFEWGIEDLCDKVVCVAADEHIRKERLMLRDRRSDEEIENLFAAQFSEDEKIRRADIVIKNNGPIESIHEYGKMFAHLPGYRDEVKNS